MVTASRSRPSRSRIDPPQRHPPDQWCEVAGIRDVDRTFDPRDAAAVDDDPEPAGDELAAHGEVAEDHRDHHRDVAEQRPHHDLSDGGTAEHALESC